MQRHTLNTVLLTLCRIASLLLRYEAYHKLNHYNLFGGGYYYDAYGLLEALIR